MKAKAAAPRSKPTLMPLVRPALKPRAKRRISAYLMLFLLVLTPSFPALPHLRPPLVYPLSVCLGRRDGVYLPEGILRGRRARVNGTGCRSGGAQGVGERAHAAGGVGSCRGGGRGRAEASVCANLAVQRPGVNSGRRRGEESGVLSVKERTARAGGRTAHVRRRFVSATVRPSTRARKSTIRRA